MPRPKRTLAEVDTNAEPATAPKKALTGRGKAKGKENEVPVTKKAPVARAAAKKPTASKAKKAPVAKAAAKKPAVSKAKKATSKTTKVIEDNSERIPVPIAATMIQNALRAKAASEKAKDNETDALVSQHAPMTEVAGHREKANAESAKAATAANPDGEPDGGIAIPKSNKSVQPSVPKATTKASNAKKAATSSKASSKAKSVAKDEDGRVSRRASGKTWICICRPSSEIAKEQGRTEDDEDEDEDEDDDDEDDEDAVDTCGGKDCLCFKLADDHPEHKWIVTKKGFELMMEWLHQADKRCPDNFDMYIFNDFYGYGIFSGFAKEQGKVNKDPLAMWSIMEGMVMFLRNCDQMPWHMIEDSDGNAKRVMLIGTALLTTIDVLIQKDLFKNSSKIRNIGLILSMFLQFSADETEIAEYNEDFWTTKVVEKADEHGVTIQGLVGIDELVEAIRGEGFAYASDSEESHPAEDEPEEMMTDMLDSYQSGAYSTTRSWRHYCWDIELEAYRETQAVKHWAGGFLNTEVDIGGNYYDLTAKRNKGSHMNRYKFGQRESRWC